MSNNTATKLTQVHPHGDKTEKKFNSKECHAEILKLESELESIMQRIPEIKERQSQLLKDLTDQTGKWKFARGDSFFTVVRRENKDKLDKKVITSVTYFMKSPNDTGDICKL